MHPRDRFAELIARPDDEIPVAEAALWIAAEANPGLDVARYLGRLDELAERMRRSVVAGRADSERVQLLNQALFVKEGFLGNQDEYADPRNSFLDEVLDRRTGIPITLSLVYVEVARRLGLDAAGIGFPGHFLAKVTTDAGTIIVDAFFGRTLSHDDCAERLRQLAGNEMHFEPALLNSASHVEILQRILANLKLLYVARQQYDAALGCSERILMLAPDSPIELRDRGLIYHELECFGPALADLERFVASAPSHPTTPAIRRILEDLRVRALRIH